MHKDGFSAIADPTRRAIIALLSHGPLPVKHIIAQFNQVSRQAVIKHLKYLEQCGVIEVRELTHESVYVLMPHELKTVYQWLKIYKDSWSLKVDEAMENTKKSHKKRK